MSKRPRSALSLSLSLLLALLTADSALLAQTSRGTVTGTVTDPQGASIGGAAVELHHRETNQTRSTVTNEAGLYRFDDVTVRASGFKATAAKDVHHTPWSF